MAKKPAKTGNDWANLIVKTMTKKSDEVAEGFQSIEEICKETGKSVTMTRMFIRKAVEDGVVEKRRYMVECGTRIYPCWHYRPISKK